MATKSEPYFNMRGGGPGRAPAMTKDFHAPQGKVAMDAFHDSDAYYRGRAAANDNRKVHIIGRPNPTAYNIAELRNLKSLVSKARDYLGDKDCAVYVIGTDYPSAVKIGKAYSPIKRLATLQTGNPETIFLHRVFWFKDVDVAMRVEAEAHKIAEDNHFRLEGEWFECIPHQAYNDIKQAADAWKLDYCVMNPTPESIYDVA